MQSISIDYLFNRVYDVLLWFKYVTLFGIFRADPKEYLQDHESRVWDGLRDRGWLDYAKDTGVEGLVPVADVHLTLWERILGYFGYKLPDSDKDGIPDVSDPSPYDPNNLTPLQLKERFQPDYSALDHLRDLFGFGPVDSDGDGVPNRYEEKHGLDMHNYDTDRDGYGDGEEIRIGTNPLNNDTDGDGIIDGRDEAPLDTTTSLRSDDTDGDRVSDFIENILGTDIQKRDSDEDFIPDGMDTYPLDVSNTGTFTGHDLSATTEGLHLSIQNPIISFVTDMYSILGVVAVFFLAYVAFRWFMVFWEAQMHYENHFVHTTAHHPKTLSHLKEVTTHGEVPMGISGLAVQEHIIEPPTALLFEKHPRWAIVEGYMSSDQEALWRIGILEADNMLMDALREKGYAGEDLGEMLKNANFRSVQLAWDAHKVRNRIAHEGTTFTLTSHEAKRTFALYEAVFREMKLI